MTVKTKDKQEQANILIGVAEKFRKEYNRVPSATELAVKCNTSTWTVYHNEHYREWFRKQKAADTQVFPAENKVLPPIWVYNEQIIVRSAELKKCLPANLCTLIKTVSQKNPEGAFRLTLQELWDQNPTRKRCGNPVFPIVAYTEQVFSDALETPKLKNEDKNILNWFVQGYFHAKETVDDKSEVDSSEIENTESVVNDGNTVNVATDLSPLVRCLETRFSALEALEKERQDKIGTLIEEVRQQNLVLAKAVTLLSKDVVAQGKLLEQINQANAIIAKAFLAMSNGMCTGTPNRTMTANAKVICKDIADETEKSSIIAKKRELKTAKK